MFLFRIPRFSSQLIPSLNHIPRKMLFRGFSRFLDQPCECGISIPEAKWIATLFNEKRLRELEEKVGCPYFHQIDHREYPDCMLADLISLVAKENLNKFDDV